MVEKETLECRSNYYKEFLEITKLLLFHDGEMESRNTHEWSVFKSNECWCPGLFPSRLDAALHRYLLLEGLEFKSDMQSFA